jgi:hypothetical protein
LLVLRSSIFVVVAVNLGRQKTPDRATNPLLARYGNHCASAAGAKVLVTQERQAHHPRLKVFEAPQGSAISALATSLTARPIGNPVTALRQSKELPTCIVRPNCSAVQFCD